MKKITYAIAIGLIITIIFGEFSGFAKQCKDIRENVFRIHVLANSDSEQDQELKLKVRDRILKETGTLFNTMDTKTKAIDNVEQNIEEIKNIAQDEVYKNGYDYPVKCEVVNMFFDTREYGEISMPAGKYDAMRVTIGDADGKNWWCVLYPPMCLPSAQPQKEMQDVLTPEQVDIVENKPKYEVKFAVVEVFEKIKNWLFD